MTNLKLEILNSKIDIVNKEMLFERCQGHTLEEVGNKFNLSRERIRQIEDKFFDTYVKDKVETFEEYAYNYIFSHYNINKQIFQFIFNNTQAHYFNAKTTTKGELSLLKSFDDINIPRDYKLLIRRFFTSDICTNYDYLRHIFVDLTPIPLTRAGIITYIVKHNCTNATTYNQLITYSNELLKANNIEKTNSLYIDRTMPNQFHIIETVISRINNTIEQLHQTFRYYDYSKYNWHKFFNALNLSVFNDVEISTLKLFNENNTLMCEYDIRNEYELHNIIRKYYDYITNTTDSNKLKLCRMPMLKFGNANRVAQIKKAFKEVNSISVINVTTYLNKEYGYAEETIMSSILPLFKKYTSGETVKKREYKSVKDYTDNDIITLSEMLTDDIYTMTNLKQIVTEIIPDIDIRKFNAFIINKLGFVIYDNFVLRKSRYNSMDDYINPIINNDSGIDLNDINDEIKSTVRFQYLLKEAIKSKSIYKYDVNKYISNTELNELGITDKLINDTCDNIDRAIKDNTYFNVTYLRNNNVNLGEIETYHFPAIFVGSLITTTNRYKNIAKETEYIFVKGDLSCTTKSFTATVTNANNDTPKLKFLNDIYNKYGLILKETDIK